MSLEPEHEMDEALEPVLQVQEDNPVWVHACETIDDNGDEQSAIHVVLSVYLGQCDMHEDHFREVDHYYSAAQARQLAASLLNASDQLDGLSPETE